MSLLREIADVSQRPDEPFRRWFSSTNMDIFLWCDDDDKVVGFQLTYDKGASERACSWSAPTGLLHAKVDDGEAGGRAYKATPLLVSGGGPDLVRITELLRDSCRVLSPDIISFMLSKLSNQPEESRST